MATTEAVKARTLLAECSAEFAGTMILILFGVGVVAQVVAGGIGDHDSIAWAWGLGVTLGVYVGGPAQRRAPQPGGHRSPWRLQGLPVAQGAPYSLAQSSARSSPR